MFWGCWSRRLENRFWVPDWLFLFLHRSEDNTLCFWVFWFLGGGQFLWRLVRKIVGHSQIGRSQGVWSVGIYNQLVLCHEHGINRLVARDRNYPLCRSIVYHNCYGTASCLLSYLINHASPILSNELSNTSVWMLWNSSLFNLLHFIIIWSCGHYYKPLLHTAYTQTLSLFSQTMFLHSYFLICSFLHTLSSYLLIFLSLTHPIAGSYPIGGYLDYILLDDKPGLV